MPISKLVDATALTPISRKHFCATIGLGKWRINAYFDKGSSSTMVSMGLVKKLGLTFDKGDFGGFTNADHHFAQYVGRISQAKITLHNELSCTLKHVMVN